jgi:multidrug efflux system membrane fusion protein
LDAAQAQWDGAQARLKEAQAGKSAAESKIIGAKALLNEAKLAYQDSELRAPITGVILKKMVEAGSLVGQGSPGYVIADVSIVKVVFGVPDILVSSMKSGQEQTITTESIPGTEFTGKITRIAPAADEKSRVFDVEISIPNTKNVLKPGMIATVNILTDKIAKPALVIPLTAVVRSPTKPEGYAVYTIKEENGKTIARVRDINLGETYQNNIAVTSGLDFNEKVITAGANIVTEGIAVTVN